VPPPTVSIVFLVYNRCEELRLSLRKMLHESTYPSDRLEVIVVDNASTDGSSEMVRAEFPEARLITRPENTGVSAWNDGFAVATGDYVLQLDDDCYLPEDGLERAVAVAGEHEADLVSFGVVVAHDPTYRFDLKYRTGLLTYWGCAVLMRREAIQALGGYDPGIFVWANELELMLRFFDRGYRHVHAPEIIAIHVKPVPKTTAPGDWRDYVRHRAYLMNTRHFAYVAAKLLKPRDAVEALIALFVAALRDGAKIDRVAFKGVVECLRGFWMGLRRRDPVRSAEISRTYRRNFHSYASPWWLSRPPSEWARSVPRALGRVAGRDPGPPPEGRRELYMARRAAYYPDSTSALAFDVAGASSG
jgi:GT2 family glycosyltransferase